MRGNLWETRTESLTHAVGLDSSSLSLRDSAQAESWQSIILDSVDCFATLAKQGEAAVSLVMTGGADSEIERESESVDSETSLES